MEKPSRRPAWRRVDRLLGEHGIGMDTAAGRRQFEERMEQRRRQTEDRNEWRDIRRGWCLGDEALRQELLAQVSEQKGENHYGQERRESDEQRAERLVVAGLAKAGWTEEDLAQRRKTDPLKLRLAARLRRETPVTLKWIASRLQAGTWKNLNRRLYEYRESKEK